jgi:outer membrane protein assembly factor BamB
MVCFGLLTALLYLSSGTIAGADWPNWRGAGRAGVWSETGIVEKFSPEGLKIQWRAPVRTGFSGPAVSGGRVFVTDFEPAQKPKGIERAIAFEEKTGEQIWAREWPVNYTGLATTYATGPRATPEADGDRVYVYGAMGMLVCLKAATGEVLWQHDLVREYGTAVPVWGMTAAPLVDGPRVIVLAGAANNSKVMAFDKMTGAVLWRALPQDSEPGYSAPIMIRAGGRRQLVQWHPAGVTSLDPDTGSVYWDVPFAARHGLSVATPVWSGLRLMISAFYNGSMMIALGDASPSARMIWRGASDSETKPDGLHALIATPVIEGDHIYGVCGYGQFRCLRASDGKQVWETQAVTGEKARWAVAHIVRNGGRYFINNDKGELIIARMSPAGYEEISRTRLIEPTSNPGNRREAGAVNWTHPAYANRHIVTRNDRELIRASLEGGSGR